MDWYYLKDGKTMGPVPEGSIRAWLESGFLQPDDLLWRSGMEGWLPILQLSEFSGREEPPSIDNTTPAGGTTGEGEPLGPSRPGEGATGDIPPRAGTRPDSSRSMPWDRLRQEPLPTPAPYAGVWVRAGAAAVDLMLLVTAVLVVFRPELPTTGNIQDMSKLNPAITPVFMVLSWLYFGLMECSTLQATLGKLAFGLKVTDLEGNRLLPGRALVRGLLKVVLMELTAFLSFLPAAFTVRRQALHDIVAGTTVLLR